MTRRARRCPVRPAWTESSKQARVGGPRPSAGEVGGGAEVAERREHGGPGTGASWEEVTRRLADELENLRVRLDLLEAPRRVQVRGLEVVDETDRPMLRLVAEADRVGVELVHPVDGGVVGFSGLLGPPPGAPAGPPTGPRSSPPPGPAR